ncbi:MAG: flavodoxin family protein [Kiritimatiellae bacterium]|nr:flavodoxin family protein [Kiritimatiellia bacterium]
MKVVAFNGSPRKDGNTAAMLRHVLQELEREGIQTELVQLADLKLRGCRACYQCFTAKNRHCALADDGLNACIDKMLSADGILLGSPTYFADLTADLKALIDRAGMTARANDEMFRRKIGAAVVAVRRAGAIHAFDSINHFFLISQMIVPGSCYWNIALGREKEEAEKDKEGVHTMQVLGQNMAWLMKHIARA